VPLRSEIILLRFPFSDPSSSKRRPVVVLTDEDERGDFACIAVTSNPHAPDGYEIAESSMESGALPRRSFVRTRKIYTLHRSLEADRVGSLAEAAFREIMVAVCHDLGCNDQVLTPE
jgi:mRNA interferase MazF